MAESLPLARQKERVPQDRQRPHGQGSRRKGTGWFGGRIRSWTGEIPTAAGRIPLTAARGGIILRALPRGNQKMGVGTAGAVARMEAEGNNGEPVSCNYTVFLVLE